MSGTDVVVALDGPAGAGKSTAARAVAARAGLRYLDTGATYRALTLGLLRRGVDVTDPDELTRSAGVPDVVLRPATDGAAVLRTWLDGAEVDPAELRSPEVTAAVSAVSACPAVRTRLVTLQRQAMAGGGVAAEGRDIGSVVWPQAEVKVFLTADPAERARRRGVDEGPAAAAALAARDHQDATRAVAPVRPAPGALVLDSTGLSPDEVVDRLVAFVDAARGPAQDPARR